MAEILICYGADFDIPDRHGNTAFHLAILGGHDRVLQKLLLKPKADEKWPHAFPQIDCLNFDGQLLYILFSEINVCLWRFFVP